MSVPKTVSRLTRTALSAHQPPTKLLTRRQSLSPHSLQSNTLTIGYSSPATGTAVPSPAAQFLLHAHNLQASDVPATGPRGRLLKADVLAKLGLISPSAPQEDARRFDKFAKPDLAYTARAPPPPPPPPPEAKQPDVEPAATVALALDVDLTPALRLQQRLQAALGAAPSLATLLERAVALANARLPAPAASRAAAAGSAAALDELLGGAGRGRSRTVVDGAFVPEINAPAAASVAAVGGPGVRTDVLDELIAPRARRRGSRAAAAVPAPVGAVNEFSVVVEEGQRVMGTVFLQRMKSLLEVEPGRLVF
jgi:hypothetical protein